MSPPKIRTLVQTTRASPPGDQLKIFTEKCSICMSGLGDQDARIAGQGVTVPSRDAGAGRAMDGQKPAWMSLLDRVNVTFGRLVSQQSRAELGREWASVSIWPHYGTVLAQHPVMCSALIPRVNHDGSADRMQHAALQSTCRVGWGSQ